MKELVTDLKKLHEDTLNNLKLSKANNTLRAYKSDFKDFGSFCAKHGFNAMPTEPKVVSLYLNTSLDKLKNEYFKTKACFYRRNSQIKRSLFRYKTSCYY